MAEIRDASGRPFARRTVALGSVALELYEGGEGRSLLFLHDATGLAQSAAVLAELARRFHVLAPLHPGFDGAALPGWMSSVDDFAHAHLELARRQGLERAIVVGASLGGWVAAEMATKTTHFIDRLVLIAPVGIKVGAVDRLDVPDIFAMKESELDRRLYAEPEKFRLDPAGKSDAELAIVAQNRETLALVGWEPYLHNPKLKHRLSSIDRPTLVLRGAQDGLVSHDYAESFARLIPGARLESIAGAAHLAHVERPAPVAERIVRFAGE
ncbi:MAG TPA: alpha/beta fold hydrolase [Stellaceae bacterium]|nr:alpha/beta fold hydrolase [Stellaceae bacterium]